MARRTGHMATALLAGVLCIVLAGCGQTTDTTTTTPETPGTEAPTTGTTPDDGAAATDGEALAKQKCTMCHTYDRIEQADKNQAEWEQTIQNMMDLGLTITDEERAAITDYLVGQSN